MTMTTDKKQTFGFQTEVKQLLHLVIHSLYSNKEIFLRELISNASDAAEKLRFKSLDNPALIKNNSELTIKVDFDKDAKTITITDNGIGMTESEVKQNLGTIAKSGTKEFLDHLTGDKSKDSQLIGQFGVGFYSAYIVADNVVVNTRSAEEDVENGVRWESTGDGEFTIEPITKIESGTEIILHLKEEETEFLEEFRLKNLITKYSDHIALPIQMLQEVKSDSEETATDVDENKKEEEPKEIKKEWTTVNKAKALWLRSKSEITDEEYNEFYKSISHDYSNPLSWTHSSVEGNLEYKSLVFLPERAPFDLWDRDRKSGLQLYVQRTFIMENADLLPSYLRFAKGIIDSNDLPLNVSREILQHNRVLEKIKKATVKKVLDLLSKMSKNDSDKYKTFWSAFGQVLKEGPVEDHENKDKVAKLLRFASTNTNTPSQEVSLEEYVGRMKEGQKYIYYVTAESFAAAKNNPQLEVFRKKGIEVLLLSDRVDEWLMSNYSEFDGKTLKSIVKGDLDLGDLDSEEEKKEAEQVNKNFESVIKQMKEVLKDKVDDVKISKRLTDSPSCIVINDYGMSMHMQKLMAEAGQMNMMGMGGGKPTLEINPSHELIQLLQNETDDAIFADRSELLFQQSMLAEGAQLEDPASFVKLMNKYITK